MQFKIFAHCHTAFVLGLLAGCSGGSVNDPLASGGSSGSGNTAGNSNASGGAEAAGGQAAHGGSGGGSVSQGGMSASSGNAGAPNANANGGASTGGSTSGGSANAGSASGGRNNAGAPSGGSDPAGGKSSGAGGKSNSAGSSAGGTSAAGGNSSSAGTTSAAGSSGGGAPSGAAELCARWKSDRTNLTEDAWNGSATGCMAGDMSATSRDTALRLVNLYRYIAGLPPVTTDPTHNQQDQACALMMQANNQISHTPSSSWTCYSADGAKAASSSNVAGTGAIAAVDGYMLDPGNATTIGHRRWILSNSLGPIGIGSTGKYSCMWTLNGTGKAGKQWMSWPSPGVFPLQAFTASRQSVDTTGWSLQSDSINLAGAQVAVTFNGTAQPVTVTQLEPNYGSRYALRFNPMGWTSAAGTYHVSVTGIATPIEYDVTVVSCN